MTETCTGDGHTSCDGRVVWVRKTQFAGDHPFCDAHARAEKDFGETSSTTVWYAISPNTLQQTPYEAWKATRDRDGFVTTVDKPFSVKDFIDKGRAAGQDALGVANDPEAIAALDAVRDAEGVTSIAAAAKARDLVDTQPIKIVREPHQPSEATIVEGTHDAYGAQLAYDVKLTRKGPGNVEFTLTIDGKICGRMPFDNLVKAATRVDPEHAVGPEKQIQKLRKETAEARAEMYDWQTKALQLEEKLRVLQEPTKE